MTHPPITDEMVERAAEALCNAVSECWPSTCDVCKGKGGWYQDEPEETKLPDATEAEARDTLLRALPAPPSEDKPK